MSGPTSIQGGPTPTTAPAKPPWYRRTWVIAVVALVVGITLGAASAGSADPKDSDEYKSLSQDLTDTQDELASTQDELSSTQDELSSTQDELTTSEQKVKTIQGDLPDREAALKKAEAALEKRQRELDEKEADLRGAAADVARRERAVGNTEKTIAQNTIPGEGIFQVGTDMQPGLYKTAGKADCYFAVLGDPNGNDILSNNITSGPATVTVSTGEYFESSGCADWVLQP